MPENHPIAERRTISVGGHDRTALVVRPAAATPPPRLLLAVHGSNQTGEGFRRFTGGGFDRWAQDGMGVVAYPDSWHGSLWNDARLSTPSKAREAGVDDLAFLRALAGELVAAGTPVFGAGYSNGGQLVIRALLQDPRLFDAAALLSATVAAPGNLVEVTGDRAVPVLMTHGTKDPLVPFEGGMASLFGFRPRGEVRSAPASAEFWARRNGIDGPPTATPIEHRGGDRTSTTRYAYEAPDRPAVVFYATDGGGHVVPNPVARGPLILGRTTGDLDVPALVLDFFASQVPAGP